MAVVHELLEVEPTVSLRARCAQRRQIEDCIAQQLSTGSQHVGSPLQRHIDTALLPRALVNPDAEGAGPPDTIVAPLRATLTSAALAKGAALLTMRTVTSLNLLLPSRRWERSVRMLGPASCCTAENSSDCASPVSPCW